MWVTQTWKKYTCECELWVPGFIISSVSENVTGCLARFLLSDISSSEIPSIEICRLCAVLNWVRSYIRKRGVVRNNTTYLQNKVILDALIYVHTRHIQVLQRFIRCAHIHPFHSHLPGGREVLLLHHHSHSH